MNDDRSQERSDNCVALRIPAYALFLSCFEWCYDCAAIIFVWNTVNNLNTRAHPKSLLATQLLTNPHSSTNRIERFQGYEGTILVVQLLACHEVASAAVWDMAVPVVGRVRAVGLHSE